MHKYHNSRAHLTAFLYNQYNDLLIADSFRMLALSMISLFIPIFLLKNNFSILEVVFSELILLISCIVFHYFILKRVGIIGIKKTLILSYFSNIGLFIIMYYLDVLVNDFGKIFFLALIIFFNSISSALYWSAHHIYFLQSISGNEGKKLGILLSIPSLVGIISPLLGAILIDKFNFQIAFLFSAIFMIIASVCLFFTDDIKVKVHMEWKEIFSFSKKRRNFIYFIHGVTYLATSFLWPIFLFYSSIKIISIGILSFFSNFFYSLIVYFGGSKSDSANFSKFGKAGAVGHGLSIICRAISETIFTLTFFQSLGGLFGGLLHVVLDSRFFKISHNNMANMIMNRELYMHLGRIFLIIVLILFLEIFNTPLKAFTACLIFSGILTVFLNLIIKDDMFD